ncbi:MAG: caspase family protein, partial [Dongia sp.]
DAAQGTFIAYSTAPGSVAADGSGSNSPYTKALAQTIVQPGVGIEEAFREVRASTMQATENKQIPWDSSSLTAPFYFKQAAASQSAPAAAPSAPKPSATAYSVDNDKAVWDGIKDSRDASDYRAYLNQYPNGIFVNIAKSRLAQYGEGVSRSETTPSPPPAAQPAAEPAAAPVTDTTTSAPDGGSDSQPAPVSINTSNSGAAKKCTSRDDTRSDADLCRRNRRD